MSNAEAKARAELAAFLALVHKRFEAQLAYDLSTNISAGIVPAEEVPAHSLKVAVVTAIGEYEHWDTDAAVQWAADVLEESNVHDLAALLHGAGGDE